MAIVISSDRSQRRVHIVITGFVVLFAAIGARLIHLGFMQGSDGDSPTPAVTAARPDIVDRNGVMLATDIKTFSLFAQPRRIVDADETIEKLATVLPDLSVVETYKKLQSGKGFVWLERQLTPRQQSEIMALGLPGVGFRAENKRLYPAAETASYIVGLTDRDNKGISGLEKYIDDQGLADLQGLGLATRKALAPVRLSVDLRVQHVARDEAQQTLNRFNALAAGAVILDIQTGEVIAMASVPDFNPNDPVGVQDKDRLNRMSAGLYEMGSTIKSFTTAMAIDSGKLNLSSKFDASRPVVIGGRTIQDFRGKGRILSMAEVFIFSSNIGSAREADAVGVEAHQEFLKRVGLLDRLSTELPEVATPTQPRVWKKIHSVTAAFGHGFSTTPLQTAVGAAALMNGGWLLPPTFLARSADATKPLARQVVAEQTSSDMRYLYLLNATAPGGSAKRAAVPGFRVGGKTGTAEKVVNGRYSKTKNFNAFVAAFPMDNPRYLVLTIVDEPKLEGTSRSVTAGLSAAPLAGNIIRRSALMLGVAPRFDEPNTSAAQR